MKGDARSLNDGGFQPGSTTHPLSDSEQITLESRFLSSGLPHQAAVKVKAVSFYKLPAFGRLFTNGPSSYLFPGADVLKLPVRESRQKGGGEEAGSVPTRPGKSVG